MFDRVLLSVHPEDGAVRDAFAAKLLAAARSGRRPTARHRRSTCAPSQRACRPGPADLMLRVINQIVDAYLDLRRELTRQLDHWQAELIDPRSRFTNWSALDGSAPVAAPPRRDLRGPARRPCRTGSTRWRPCRRPTGAAELRERELIMVRSRDVLEHIERVVHHVRRLEQNAETAVQMHFSVQSHRANDIMRVLTVLTAIFLPLNLIAGIFGMNFEFIPLVHKADGFWIAMGSMGVIAVALVAGVLAQALPGAHPLTRQRPKEKAGRRLHAPQPASESRCARQSTWRLGVRHALLRLHARLRPSCSWSRSRGC